MRIKNILIRVSILIALLAGVTVLFARQDVILRVTLNEETLIRNGQYMTASLNINTGEQIVYQAETPYYSLYEYNIKIPHSIWNNISDIRIEIGQVRRGDHIYIESISVKRPFCSWHSINNSELHKKLYDITSSEINLTDNQLPDIKVLETRAQTTDMSIEGPGFSLPAEMFKAKTTVSFLYVISILVLILLWVTAAIIFSKKINSCICNTAHKITETVKTFAFTDVAIILTGVLSLIFYHCKDYIPYAYNNLVYQVLSAVTILLIILKLISTNTNSTIDNTLSDITGTARRIYNIKWLPYVLLFAISCIIYIPAIFPNPYYYNDENIVIGAAESYLRHGNFDSYNRAWPHTWLVAQAVELLDKSTASTRLVSALFGVFFIVSSYHIINKISQQKKIAILSAVLLLVNPAVTEIFVTVRMYAMMLPMSLWMFYCIYMTLHSNISYKRDNVITRLIITQFNFHFIYAAATFMLMWLNFQIHGNAMIIPLCAVVYIIILALTTKQRKYINLSIISAAGIIAVIALYFLSIMTPLRITVVTRPVNYLLDFFGFGWYNYIYFWDNISIPLGLFFGIFFLSVTLIAILRYPKKTAFLIYPAVCYVITVLFFIFFADRYYEYVYMSFLIPITIMLIASGVFTLAGKIEASTKNAVCILVAAAVVLQFCSTFSYTYIDKPDRTKFDRPYAIIANDAKLESVDVVYLHATYVRRHWVFINGSESLGFPSSSGYQIDWLLERVNYPVIYFLSEESKMFRINEPLTRFLETRTDKLTDIDNSVAYKYHFIEPAIINAAPPERDINNTLSISDVKWDADVAYLSCGIDYISEFDGAVFIAVEVSEQGIAQSATHRYQVFVPDGFAENSRLIFNLPVHPKTEEYSENIRFMFSDELYVYYGRDKGVIIP